MRLTTRTMRIAVAAACLVVTATSCSSTDTSNQYSGVAVAATRGTSGEPDVNGDGKVVIAVMSPGDLNDHGYYESFVAKSEAFTARQGWTLKKYGGIKAADALQTAKEICVKEKPDLIALGAAELASAIPASADPVCAKTTWYVPSGVGINQTPKIAISRDFINEGLLAAGYANGLLMEAQGYDKAGYITGPELDFSTQAAKAFIAGIRMKVPNAKLVTAYTGSFDDSKLAAAAAQKQIGEGLKVIYPYLGGATDAVAKLGNQHDVILSTPGTDRCDSTSPRFQVSVIFDPGEYFAGALADFADGNLKMGVAREWHLGKDTVPTVRICNGTDSENAAMAQFIADVGSGKIDPNAEVSKLGNLNVS